MNATLPVATLPTNLMTSTDYRKSLRRYIPIVYVDGKSIDSVVHARSLQPGINALGVTYGFPLMLCARLDRYPQRPTYAISEATTLASITC